jgi:hypothetical protein
MSENQIKKYDTNLLLTMRRERSRLAYFRMKKMQNLIIREMTETIREAEDEPEASFINQMDSIIEQNLNNVHNLWNKQSFVEPELIIKTYS